METRRARVADPGGCELSAETAIFWKGSGKGPPALGRREPRHPEAAIEDRLARGSPARRTSGGGAGRRAPHTRRARAPSCSQSLRLTSSMTSFSVSFWWTQRTSPRQEKRKGTASLLNEAATGGGASPVYTAQQTRPIGQTCPQTRQNRSPGKKACPAQFVPSSCGSRGSTPVRQLTSHRF